jgi:two-component system, LytTR family, response regulator
MKTLIVEDEDSSFEVLENMLQKHHEQVQIAGRAKTVVQAIEQIESMNPELVFMDIDLPDGTGFDIIRKLRPINFSIIFITAFDQYAVQAFRFSATDFLLKPVCEEELFEAIEKVNQNEKQKNLDFRIDVLLANLQAQVSEGKKIILKTMEDIFIVSTKEIINIQSDGAYSHFFLISGKRITVSTNLKKYEEMLFDQGFFRSHQCHLVNLMHVERFHKLDGGMLIMKNGSSVPVSNRKKDALLDLLNRF